MTRRTVDAGAAGQDPTRAHDRAEYTGRLEAKRAWWKRLFNTQAPFRRNIRAVVEGRVLDVGCGVGRNLLHLDGNGVGVDSNEHSVEVCRRAGLRVHTTDEFFASDDARPESFDTLLFAHVLEHMTTEEANDLVGEYLPYVRPGGLMVVLVPQEAGFRSDPTHVDFVGDRELRRFAVGNGLEVVRISAFPLPRLAGKFFRYNETVALMRKPARATSGVG